MNALYANELSLYLNYFTPSFKLIDKQRIGSNIKKVHSKPMTPYQRLIEAKDVDDALKAHLTEVRERLNPFELKAIIDKKIRKIKNEANHSKTFQPKRKLISE